MSVALQPCECCGFARPAKSPADTFVCWPCLKDLVREYGTVNIRPYGTGSDQNE